MLRNTPSPSLQGNTGFHSHRMEQDSVRTYCPICKPGSDTMSDLLYLEYPKCLCCSYSCSSTTCNMKLQGKRHFILIWFGLILFIDSCNPPLPFSESFFHILRERKKTKFARAIFPVLFFFQRKKPSEPPPGILMLFKYMLLSCRLCFSAKKKKKSEPTASASWFLRETQ